MGAAPVEVGSIESRWQKLEDALQAHDAMLDQQAGVLRGMIETRIKQLRGSSCTCSLAFSLLSAHLKCVLAHLALCCCPMMLRARLLHPPRAVSLVSVLFPSPPSLSPS